MPDTITDYSSHSNVETLRIITFTNAKEDRN